MVFMNLHFIDKKNTVITKLWSHASGFTEKQLSLFHVYCGTFIVYMLSGLCHFELLAGSHPVFIVSYCLN